MPVKGKHRRPRTRRLTRKIAVAGTGGAALALPLIGATGAHAVPAQNVPGKVTQAVPVAAPQANSGARTYTVRPGDWLAKIADRQNVSGGWQRVYDDNRQVIGDNPSLIHPGLKLTLGRHAAPTHTEPSTRTAPSAAVESFAPAQAVQPTQPAKSTQPPQSTQVPVAQASAPQQDTAPETAVAAPAPDFTLPVSGATIGTAYHVAGSMWSSGYHTGVDFVVPTGTPLKAVGAGTVVSAGWGGAYGNQVVIRLNDGYYAQYAHLSQLSVSAGQTVTAGQQVGLSGATGNVTGPHLHFEIRTTPNYGSDIDPLGYLRQHGVPVG
ncbi:peptidoglycan DD-metalloendopeptidase family protein [Streptomyces sp. NPDC048297]|uniref:M23 family metallopeptidase n=1 Tax=Streptomyces sp. NPDC048297 TaxID=3365531 RepID=UPI0037240B2B